MFDDDTEYEAVTDENGKIRLVPVNENLIGRQIAAATLSNKGGEQDDKKGS